jgi:hypothetical protein
MTCSWCEKEMNLKTEPGSHGICPRHKAQEMADFLKWKTLNSVEDALSMQPKESNHV